MKQHLAFVFHLDVLLQLYLFYFKGFLFFSSLLAPLVFQLLPKMVQILFILRTDTAQAFLCLIFALRLDLDIAQGNVVVQNRVCFAGGRMDKFLYANLASVDA